MHSNIFSSNSFPLKVIVDLKKKFYQENQIAISRFNKNQI